MKYGAHRRNPTILIIVVSVVLILYRLKFILRCSLNLSVYHTFMIHYIHLSLLSHFYNFHETYKYFTLTLIIKKITILISVTFCFAAFTGILNTKTDYLWTCSCAYLHNIPSVKIPISVLTTLSSYYNEPFLHDHSDNG